MWRCSDESPKKRGLDLQKYKHYPKMIRGSGYRSFAIVNYHNVFSLLWDFKFFEWKRHRLFCKTFIRPSRIKRMKIETKSEPF